MLRTVQFWRLAGADGTALRRQFPAADAVRQLAAAQRNGLRRYRTAPDGTEVLAEALADAPHPLIALYRTRRVNLPRVDDNGTILPLPLTAAQAVAEASYFSFQPRNVVAVLHNNEGPRAPRLVDYLNSKLGAAVSLQPILRSDIAKVLADMRMTSVELSVSSAQVAAVGGGDGWAQLLDNASALMRDGAISVKISIGRGGSAADRASRGEQIRALVRQLRGRDPGQLTSLNRAKVTGVPAGFGSPITVDLLAEKFVARVGVDDELAVDVGAAAQAAGDLLHEQGLASQAFLRDNTPRVDADPDSTLVGVFVAEPADE